MILLYSQLGFRQRGLTFNEIRERYKLMYPLKNVKYWDVSVLAVLESDSRFCIDRLHLKPIYSLTEKYLAEEMRDGNIDCIKAKKQRLSNWLDASSDLLCGHEMVEESLVKAKVRMQKEKQFDALTRINSELHKRREIIRNLSKQRDRCRIELHLFE